VNKVRDISPRIRHRTDQPSAEAWRTRSKKIDRL
jgi:hypothetical protein